MGHGKETPRQKMIGMMYLVLTALLALNVQREVLDAFAMIDDGLTQTTKNFTEKSKGDYTFIEMAAAQSAAKAVWLDKATEIKNKTNELVNAFQKRKIELINLCDGTPNLAVEGETIHPSKINGKDQMDKVAQMMVLEGKATELRKQMEALKELYINTVQGSKFEDARRSIEVSLSTVDPPAHEGVQHTWESTNFTHIPLAAVLAVMSGMQANIRNAESEVIKYIKIMSDAGISFNKVEAAIIPNTNYVMSGNEYTARIFIAASDSNQKTRVLLGDYESYKKADGSTDYKMKSSFDSIKEFDGGKAIYRVKAGSVGAKKVRGLIAIGAGEDGKHVPFELDYTVGEPAVIVSPTAMNVFYIGVDNPVEISIPGIGGDKIAPSINNGTITKAGKGGYIVRVSRPGTASVTVMADMGTGSKKNMGAREFRVKTVPDPVAKIGGIKISGAMSQAILLAQTGLVAELENFDFNIKYNISDFKISYTDAGGFSKELNVKGTRFDDASINFLKGAGKNKKVYFEEIYAVMQGGSDKRKLGSIIITVR